MTNTSTTPALPTLHWTGAGWYCVITNGGLIPAGESMADIWLDSPADVARWGYTVELPEEEQEESR